MDIFKASIGSSLLVSAFLLSGVAYSVEFASPELEEKSKVYSQDRAEEYPEIQIILNKLELKYLHELDPDKVYTLNKKTNDVVISSRQSVAIKDKVEGSEVAPASILDFGFGSNVTKIEAGSGTIDGLARTVITCPFSAQTAEVSGFMASTVSRDPIGAGIREGVIFSDDFITTGAEVRFSILKVPGGARNPINRTAMETTHTGSCGDDFRLANLVSTWPPLRVELTIDDTGSMSNELSGLKTALANFIDSQSSSDGATQRDVSYELISFKDSPSLRLANTSDNAAAKSAVQSLFPSGGGDCPEDSLGALDLALNRLPADEDASSEIVLVTDASPQAGDVDALIATANSLGVPVNVLLSGDCVAAALVSAATSSVSALDSIRSAREVFRRIAEETGGEYVFEPGGSAEDYARILQDIFDSALSEDTLPPEVSVSVTPDLLWPPNHKMILIDVDVTAVDNLGSCACHLVGWHRGQRAGGWARRWQYVQ